MNEAAVNVIKHRVANFYFTPKWKTRWPIAPTAMDERLSTQFWTPIRMSANWQGEKRLKSSLSGALLVTFQLDAANFSSAPNMNGTSCKCFWIASCIIKSMYRILMFLCQLLGLSNPMEISSQPKQYRALLHKSGLTELNCYQFWWCSREK